jgi:hypothetical protein
VIQTCWEDGVSCSACGYPIALGEEMLYGRHLGCARDRETARSAHGSSAALRAAADALAAGGRIAVSRAHLRELVAGCCGQGVIPVRRPDAGAKGPWYGRVAGWKAERVRAGLSLAETCGLYLDYLDIGRVPPLSRDGLAALIGCLSTEGAARGGGQGE